MLPAATTNTRTMPGGCLESTLLTTFLSRGIFGAKSVQHKTNPRALRLSLHNCLGTIHHCPLLLGIRASTSSALDSSLAVCPPQKGTPRNCSRTQLGSSRSMGLDVMLSRYGRVCCGSWEADSVLINK